jgi:hypothetical protein
MFLKPKELMESSCIKITMSILSTSKTSSLDLPLYRLVAAGKRGLIIGSSDN